MTLKTVFDSLYITYGPQHWWPGDTPFEIMVGAVLTQNTAWGNVEKAIANLKRNNALEPNIIASASLTDLTEWLRPSGYFNVKAKRLRNYCTWYVARGGYDALSRLDTKGLRSDLLSVNGVGPETADDIVLYAFERPVFVIDAYTRRLFTRMGLINGDLPYEALRLHFEQRLASDVALYNEYHALIVRHVKHTCTKRPRCGECCLGQGCPRRGGN